MLRGMIACPAEIEILDNGFRAGTSISAAEIRFYLLYWNKVFIPTNNLVHIGIPEEDVLVETGAIYRPRVPLTGRFTAAQVGESILNNQCELAKLMEKDTTTFWTMHQRGTGLLVPKEYSSPRDLLRIEIANALLSPSPEVEIYDVLDFRERHAAKLSLLHELLDHTYLEILSSPDPDIKKISALRELERAAEDHNRSMLKRFTSTTSFDLSAELNVTPKDAGSEVIKVAIGNNLLSLGMSTLEIIGAAGITSAITVSAKATRAYKHTQNNPQLAYLSRAHIEGITR